MKTAGLVLDFYDDKTGSILKEMCPSPDQLPEAVKVAHILSPEERDVLRDEAFALILHNDGDQLRKFACVDEGNTVLSTIYFMEMFDRLPPEAAKTAAINLAAFNEEFGLPVPDMLKLAAETGMARRRDSMKQPLVGDEADWAQRTNLLSVRGGADSGRVIPTVNQMKTAGVMDSLRQGFDKVKSTEGFKKVKDTVGAEMHDPFIRESWGHHAKRKAREAVGAVQNKIREHPLKAAGGAAVVGGLVGHAATREKTSNVVDVSALEADPVVINKTAARTALGDRFSLDSYSDVQDAIQYFSDGWPELSPEDRHEFSVKTAARAEELGIELPELMSRYGSTEYGPDVDAHLANRRSMAPHFGEVWNELQEKRAMIEPEQFAALLKEADEHAGLNYEWGGAVFDPYYATFGGRSEQEKLAWAWQGADGEKIDEDGLRAIPQDKLAATFSPDFVEAFSHDPVTIFESMPDQHKVLISRMV